ncbi:hypothetical protein SNE40_009642 [Patella caerulea]|uniref:MADF domain-containing protein n=1 Tax=Patella caerulea TaxID=87958 RepID=A0AAN8JZ05_PATCE
MATPTPETWSLIKEEELATLWSERPCLFEITMPEYRDRVAKDRAMIEIAGKLAMTVEQIKTRMKSLRTQLGKVIKSPPVAVQPIM